MSLSVRGPRWQTFPVFLAAGLSLAVVSCTGSAPGPGEADQRTESMAPSGADEMGLITAHKALIASMEASDVAAVTALVDPSSDLLIFHPFLENRFDGIGEVDAGLARMFEQLGKVSWTDAHAAFVLQGNVGWVTSHVMVKSAARPGMFIGRGTEIWVHDPAGWRLKHAHWSENAELAGSLRDSGN